MSCACASDKRTEWLDLTLPPSYFLSVLADRDLVIARNWKAVEGLSGVAVVYLIFAVVLTCCLGGISFFAFLALVLDVAFCGAMIAIAILTRDGAHSCSGVVVTPIGTGYDYDKQGFDKGNGNNVITYAVTLGTACRLNKAAFAVSIIAAILFLVTAGLQIALVRRHKEEKRYGPSPSNNYTSGSGRRFGFGRKNKNKDAELGPTGTAVGAGGLAAGHPDTRPSHETGYTGSTAAASGFPGDKVDGGAPVHSTHGGYYTQPQGTGTNPYGYAAPGTATNY